MRHLYRVAYVVGVLVLSIFLILPLSACQQPPQQAKNVTIRFVYPSQFSADPAVNQALAKQYEDLASAFHEKIPNITIKLVPLTWEQMSTLAATDYDVLVFQDGYYADYAKRGLVRSLEPWISLQDQAWSADYRPTVLQPFERNGELWAIPWALDPVILYYNKELFTQNGVAAPQKGWTWSDFLEKANAITNSDNSIYGSVILNMYALVPGVIYQHGGQLFDNYSERTQVTFDNPLNIEALDWLASLIYKYHVIPTQAEAIRMYGSGMIALSRGINKGKFGMWTAQYIERGGESWGTEGKWTVPWGAAPLPQDEQAATLVMAYLLGISSHATDADASWQWLSYLSQQMPPELLLPARTSLLANVTTADASMQEAFTAGTAALDGTLLITSDNNESAWPALEAFWAAVEAILQKGEPAEAQLQSAQDKAK